MATVAGDRFRPVRGGQTVTVTATINATAVKIGSVNYSIGTFNNAAALWPLPDTRTNTSKPIFIKRV